MRRLPNRMALLVLFTCTVLVITAWPAAAHTYLERSEPGADDTVTQEVTEVVLEFNQAVNQSIADLEVTAPDGAEVGIGEVRIDGKFVRRDVGPLPVEGEYEVSWRVVASDGHPLEGEFAFDYEGPMPEATVEPTEEPIEVAPEPTEEPSTPAPAPAEDDDAMAGGAEMSTPPPMDADMAAGEGVSTTATDAALPRALLTLAGLVLLGLVLSAWVAIRGLLRWEPPTEQPST